MDQESGPSAESDSDVIERVRRGGVQAYGVLVQRYEGGVLAAVLPIVRDTHSAQDVVQDVFVQCYLKLSTLRDGSRFVFWLMKTARRKAVRAARRRKWMAAAPMTDVAMTNAPPFDDDQHRRLLECVGRLPSQEQLVVSLHYFDGHGVSEIARMTGRPVGTVTKQLSRAVDRLRGQLNTEIPSCPTKSTSSSRSAIA